ncbi:hypothetical protein ACWDRB_29605 [Nonomuraea sp. NPDC003707]|uniref:hypothetical protein n=1 Tax=Nonomuraea angiospora TaxID=46172 RepID=UPI003450B96D
MTRETEERQRACQETLLAALRNELVERDTPASFLIEDSGRPAVEVLDVEGRPRRIYVHLQFRWFYWGDEPNERISCLQLLGAVDRVQQAAEAGWREGDQGEQAFSLHTIADAYRF